MIIQRQQRELDCLMEHKKKQTLLMGHMTTVEGISYLWLQ